MELRVRPRRICSAITILLGIMTTSHAGGADLLDHSDARNIANLGFRNAAFQLDQQHYFSSILQLLHARELPKAFAAHSDNKAFLADFLYDRKALTDFSKTLVAGRLADAQLSKDESDVVLADLYLAIGLPNPAEKLLRRLDGKRTAAPKHSWLAAARFFYQRGYLKEAQQALAELADLPNGELQTQRDTLAALVQLAARNDVDAIAKLRDSVDQGEQLALDRYNLGLALMNKGDTQEGMATLDDVNNTAHGVSNYLYKSKLWSDIKNAESVKGDAAGQQRLQAIFITFLKDIAAVNLGQAFMHRGQTDLTATPLQGIDPNTPYANFPLLDKGWIDYLSGHPGKALESWTALSQRDGSDAAVQEGMLATPYTYYRLQDYPKALKYFQQAAAGYQNELKHLEAARPALTDGSYIQAFLDANPGKNQYDIAWRPQILPALPISSYLLPTLISHRFVEGLKNYRDLLFTQDILATAGNDINASLDLLTRQRALNVGLVNVKTVNGQGADPNVIMSRVKKVQAELTKAERNHDIVAFATTKQAQLLNNLQDAHTLLGQLKDYIVDNDVLHAKYQLLRGLMIWDLTEQYPTRLQEVTQQLQDLENNLDRYVSVPQQINSGATHGHDALTKRENNYKTLLSRQAALQSSAKTLATQQRKYLEALLVQDVQDAESRLKSYLIQARLGVAEATDQLASKSPNRDYAETIAAYQAFLDISGDSPYRRAVMYREACLKMLQADTRDDSSTDGSTAKTAHERADALYDDAAKLLEQLLKRYPNDPDNDRVLYGLAKAYDHSGDSTAMLDTLTKLTQDYPHSAYNEEAQFRRGELLFSVGLPGQAADAYSAVVAKGPDSPFYDKALYKLGWSRFKQGHYQVAVDTFIPLLDRNWPKTGSGNADTTDDTATRGQQEFVDDILRGTSLCLAQLKGVETLKQYFTRHGAQPYEYRLYATLAQLYIEQQRIEDAVNVYRTFVAQRPDSPLAPQFDSKILAAYEKGGFIDLAQKAKQDFIARYQPNSPYWQKNPNADRTATLASVHDYLQELTNYAHAKAQQTKLAADYQKAEDWYRLFLKSFPKDPQASKMHFLFAELLYEDHKFDQASQEYAKVAYEYKDANHGAEAAYADILAREKVAATLSGDQQQAAQQQALLALQRFTDTYPDDPRTPAALVKSAQQWFARHQPDKAEQAAHRLLDIKPPADAALRRDAWTVLAHSQFDQQHFSDAEHSYQQVLAIMPKSAVKRNDIQENLAAAVYKQGEAARTAGDLHTAAHDFLRIKDLAPDSSIVATAQYDGAAALLALKDWQKAIPLLVAFRSDYPDNPLQKDIAPKLALAYQKDGDWQKAAGELEGIARHGDNQELQRDAVWQSATLYLRAGKTKQARRMYLEYVKRFPKPLDESIEAQQHLADLYAQQHDTKRQHYWLKHIIATEKNGGDQRSDHTRLLAGRAALTLADAQYQDYINIKLTHPLKKSLKRKKQVMEKALSAYRVASDYGIAEITTAATYRAAQIYSNLGKALMNSERPKGLSKLELEQYNVLLEEQAYPFEEKAIALHESNAHRTTEHIYDDWVKQSFAALSKLLPGRYAKKEKGDDYVDAIY